MLITSFFFHKRFFYTHNGGHEWRLEPSGQQVLPVHVPEEGLFLDIFGVTLAGSQTSLRILSQQLRRSNVLTDN